MKKIVLAALAAAFLSFQLTAQPRNDNGCPQERPTVEQLTQRRCNRLITSLNLDDKTSQEFCEIYKAYVNEMIGIKDQYPLCRQQCIEGQDPQPLTDQEIETNIMNRFKQSRALIDIREKYYHEFREILTPRQIQRIYGAERERASDFRHNHQTRNCQPHHRDRHQVCR